MRFDSRRQTNMSEGNLTVAEIQERAAVPPMVKKKKPRFFLLTGAILLVALATVWMVKRSWPAKPVQPQANQTTELTVTVVHPQKASITIPVLPGQTQAYTD